MPRRPLALLLLSLLPLSVAVAACSDDGASVRRLDTETAARSGSTPAAASGTGLSLEQTRTAGRGDARVASAVARYRDYVSRQVDRTIAATTVLTDAVRAGDLRAARAAYAPSRAGWERIEPIAGLVASIDRAVDARVDEFAGPGDPRFTGWHRLEYQLWKTGTTAGAAPVASRLDRDLATLRRRLRALEIPPAAMALGASELIEEVSKGKITGEEDRYSKTDLWDVAGNVEGARKVVELLTPALRQADPGLLARIEAGFADLDAGLRPLRDGDGWVPFCRPDDAFPSGLCPRPTVTRARIDTLIARLAGLSEDLALVPGVLGLR